MTEMKIGFHEKNLNILHLKTRDGKIFYLAHRILMGSQKKGAL